MERHQSITEPRKDYQLPTSPYLCLTRSLPGGKRVRVRLKRLLVAAKRSMGALGSCLSL